MTQNPYAKFLGDGDAMETIVATPARLVALVSGLSAEQIDAPMAPGKWSRREIIAHLADCEIAFGFRLRQALAGVSIQPFDQDAWAESYARVSLAGALETFIAVRLWNVVFANGLSDAEKMKPVNHPERGDMALWTIVETMAGHDLNHVEQLERTSHS